MNENSTKGTKPNKSFINDIKRGRQSVVKSSKIVKK